MRTRLFPALAAVLLATAGCGAATEVVEDVAAVTTSSAPPPPADPEDIEGVQTYQNPSFHDPSPDLTYPQTPPSGGTHNPQWADCTGTVYQLPIANRYAVHSQEHGAVWVTYGAAATDEEIATLAAYVEGQDYTLMSPFPSQPTKVSLQSWNHQLALDDVDDLRLQQFLDGFRASAKYTPEFGATCANPAFAADPIVEDSG